MCLKQVSFEDWHSHQRTDECKNIYYLDDMDARRENDKNIGWRIARTVALRCMPLRQADDRALQIFVHVAFFKVKVSLLSLTGKLICSQAKT